MSHDRATVVSVRIEAFEDPREDSLIEWLECWECGSRLLLSQPDSEEPHRFLGTCGDCGQWYLIEQPEMASQLFMIELPQLTETELNRLTQPTRSLAGPDRSLQAGA